MDVVSNKMNGGDLRIVANSPPVLRLFEITGLADFLNPFSDLVL